MKRSFLISVKAFEKQRDCRKCYVSLCWTTKANQLYHQVFEVLVLWRIIGLLKSLVDFNTNFNLIQYNFINLYVFFYFNILHGVFQALYHVALVQNAEVFISLESAQRWMMVHLTTTWSKLYLLLYGTIGSSILNSWFSIHIPGTCRNIWRSFSEDKRAAFAHLDCLFFMIYKNENTHALEQIKRKEIFSKKYVFVPIVCWYVLPYSLSHLLFLLHCKATFCCSLGFFSWHKNKYLELFRNWTWINHCLNSSELVLFKT